jgi:predicted short-subunit dehydrogenase-like oxidoreductase (DUF2520 family)
MKIVLIGAGKVAGSLGRIFVQHGHQILQVMNRTAERGAPLARELGAGFSDQFAAISPDADLYVVALADRALPELMLKWQLNNQLVVHTAGTLPITVLQGVSPRFGVLYPLQSLTGKIPVSGSVPFLIQAAHPDDLAQLMELVHSVGSSCQVVTDQQRLRMHVSAVWVNNFPNLMFSIAYRLCQEHQLSFELLLPLIRETVLRMDPDKEPARDPFYWQTGPAMREDLTTIRRHLELMNPHPDWKDLYEHLTEEIISYKSQMQDTTIQKAE